MLPFIDTGFFKIPVYGIMIGAAYLVSYSYLIKRSSEFSFEKETVENLMFYTLVWGFAGAKFFYIITFFNEFGNSFSERFLNIFSLNNLRAGFVFYGGFISGSVFFYIYTKRKKIDFLKTADFFAPAIALAHSIGRLGCFSAGCCHGRLTDSVFGVRFTKPYCDVSPDLLGLKIHPTQLYESAGNLIIFLILNRFSQRKDIKKGSVIFLYILSYSVLRFIVEFFRGDYRGGYLFHLSQAQWISILIIIISVLFFKINIWKKK